MKGDQTYTSPDGVFQFRYPDWLVVCKHDPDATNIAWIPENDCSAYIPVCSANSCKMEGTLGCIAYPKEKLRDAATLEAGALSVNVIDDANSESKCNDLPEPPPHVGSTRLQIINGAIFRVTQTDGAASTQFGENYAYRTFHDGKCYELDIRIASRTGTTLDPPAKQFNVTPVHKSLSQVLKTFRFLK